MGGGRCEPGAVPKRVTLSWPWSITPGDRGQDILGRGDKEPEEGWQTGWETASGRKAGGHVRSRLTRTQPGRAPTQLQGSTLSRTKGTFGLSRRFRQWKNSPAMQKTQETWVWSLGQEDPLEEDMAATPVFLPGKTHGQRSLVGYSPWGGKESDTTEWLTHTGWLDLVLHQPHEGSTVCACEQVVSPRHKAWTTRLQRAGGPQGLPDRGLLWGPEWSEGRCQLQGRGPGVGKGGECL